MWCPIFILLAIAATTDCNVDFQCPSNQFFIYPCKCHTGGQRGLAMTCSDANLAMISLGLTNVKMPIQSLTIDNCNITHLFGPLFESQVIYELKIFNSSVSTIEESVLLPLNTTLRSLSFTQNKLNKIPDNVINKLTNLTKLVISHNKAIVEVKNNEFPKLVNLTELDLSKNSIKKLASNSLNGLTALETLDLNDNKLVTIERNLFRTLKKLKYLDLSRNLFKEIGKSDFNDLSSLLYLNLSHNQLTQLPRNVLTRNAQLRTINLSYNKLKEIDTYLLKGVRFLRDFYARGNEITEVARRTFSSTTRLKLIDLSANKLEILESEMFKDMQWLDKLDLSENRITRIASGAFQRMFQVAINLTRNNISIIESKAFQELSNITELDLSHNVIEKVHRQAFDECDVTLLYLNHNLISNLSKVAIFANMTGIRFLNLSHNQITELTRRDFTPKRLFELHTLDLSHNNISDITGTVFEKFASIRFIHLHHNRLAKIGFAAFGSLPTLLELDISYNNISDITNGGLSSLVSVKTIYANNNRLKKMFNIPLALNTLHLEYNNISQIRSNIFPMINSLLEIYLDHNNISALEDSSFAHCLTLNTLSLSYNNISTVPHNTLQHLTSLQYLYLNGNRLTKLERKAFGNLRIVFHLRLDSNQITNISVSAFEGLLQLLKLNISDNKLSHLSPEVFNTLVSLQSLDLSHNQLNQLDNRTHGLFEPLLSMQYLNLSYNRVSLIKEKSFPSSPWIPYKLKHLDLSNNFIPILTHYLDDGLKRVEWLSFRDNIINDIQANIFANMTYLRNLDLSGNQLRKLAKGLFAGSLANLTHLSVARNKLSAIFVPEIVNMRNLKLLNISSNRLMNIHHDLVNRIKSGLRLDFDDNHLFCDCHLQSLMAWIKDDVIQAELNGRNSQILEHWSRVICKEPNTLVNKSLIKLKPTQLNCVQQEIELYSSHFIEANDLKIRAIEWSKRVRASVKIVWLVLNRVHDIASFRVILRLTNSVVIANETLGYNYREYVINGLNENSKYIVCVTAIDSNGKQRQTYDSQCAAFDRSHTYAVNAQTRVTLDQFVSSASVTLYLHFVTRLLILFCFVNNNVQLILN